MRYLLFGKDEFYYASGGAHDYLGSGNSIDDLASSQALIVDGERIAWWHIFDTQNRKIVAGTKYQAHGADNIDGGYSS